MGKTLCSFLSVACTTIFANTGDYSFPSRFSGVFSHEKITKDQYAKIDFIFDEDGLDVPVKFAAVVTLYFGGFNSYEYQTYHYDYVTYDARRRLFLFDNQHEDLFITTKEFDGSNLVLEARSNLARGGGAARKKVVGQFHLSSTQQINPTRPLLQPLWGEYIGQCQPSRRSGKMLPETHLQLYTYRDTNKPVDGGRRNDYFSMYQIKGEIGNYFSSYSCEACGSRTNRPCTFGKIYRGSYNFFEDKLDLFGFPQSLNCAITASSDGLDCVIDDERRCEFKRTRHVAKPVAARPVKYKNKLFTRKKSSAAPTGDADAVPGGEYVGYMHHELLDLYQIGAVSIIDPDTQEPPTSPESRMNVMASLYFDELGGDVGLHYQFPTFDLPADGSKIIFNETENKHDAILMVTNFSPSTIEGIWYSKIFGRVGEFKFNQGDLPPLPNGLKAIPRLGGKYRGQIATGIPLEIKLDSVAGQLPPLLGNAYAPLTFDGYTRIAEPADARKIIFGGSYDFYTGRLAIDARDMSSVSPGGPTDPATSIDLHPDLYDASLVGHVELDGTLRLVFRSQRLNSRLNEIEQRQFNRIK